MKVGVISVGSEILKGRLLNKDLGIISSFLKKFGIPVVRETTVKDDVDEIIKALNGFSDYDLVFITGGLGPTSDDVTKKALARFLGVDMIMNESVLTLVRKKLDEMGIEFLDVHKRYGYVPEGAEIIENSRGLAPGMLLRRGNLTVISLPGPPREVEAVLEKLESFFEKYGKKKVHEKTIRTFGLRETQIYELLKNEPYIHELAFYPSLYGVDIRIEKDDEEELEKVVSSIKQKLGENIYGFDDETMEQVLGRLIRERNLTIATAESCSGGLLANLITDVSGSSNYFIGGMVAYHNRIKMEFLGVPEEILIKYGAVSEPTALYMAEGIRKLYKTDIGLSTTGIAGPTGGTPEKPVGLVYMGFSFRGDVHVIKRIFKGSRLEIKRQTAYTIMDFARRYIEKNF